MYRMKTNNDINMSVAYYVFNYVHQFHHIFFKTTLNRTKVTQ